MKIDFLARIPMDPRMVACGDSGGPSTALPDLPTVTAVQTNPSPIRNEIRPNDGAEMVFVPAGEFPMGSSEAEVELAKADCPQCPANWFDDEKPQHPVFLEAYLLDKY